MVSAIRHSAAENGSERPRTISDQASKLLRGVRLEPLEPCSTVLDGSPVQRVVRRISWRKNTT